MASILGKLLKRKNITQAATGAATKWEALSAAAAKALQERQFERAIQLYDEVIAQKGDDAEIFYKRANAFHGLGRWEMAVEAYDRALALDPRHGRAHCNRGTALERLARWQEALASYDRAIELAPDDYLSYYNRGSALRQLELFEEALLSYERALALKGDYVAAYINSGNLLQHLKRYKAALANYEKAIELDQGNAAAFLGRGASLVSLRRFNDAMVSYDQAIAVDSLSAEAYTNRGLALQDMGQAEAAIASFAKAIELKPDFAAAYQANGVSLLRLQRFEAAIESFDRAIAIEPLRPYLLGMRLHTQMQICDWTNLTSQLEKLTAGLKANAAVSVPLAMLALTDSPELHRSAAEIWLHRECPHDGSLGPIAPRTRGRKIHIGYFSSDFCEHAVSLVTAELFEMHDRSRFEIIAFAFGPRPNDAMRARLQGAFDRFIDVRDRSDIDVAMLARSLEIDIAVDLNGYTEHSRTAIFALRAAPIQINYLGYPGTMGAQYMDYLIADHIVVPELQQRQYAERIIYLPHSYFPHDSTRRIAATEFTPREHGLPSDGFVFCCFNNSYKIAPNVFSCWMRILKRTDHSVIWLAASDPVTARNLRREAERRGVTANRLVFASRIGTLAEHLARLRCADLLLDTLPYNAHASATDALWAGLPLITRCGESFAARVAASLLTAVGLPELITSTEEQYEDLAVDLATNPRRLRDIKDKLVRSRSSAPLFDTRSFAAHLESAYERILERHHSGLPPDHIDLRA